MNRKKQDMGSFLRLLKRAKIPWQWYILYLILSLALSNLSVKMMAFTGQIMSGELHT